MPATASALDVRNTPIASVGLYIPGGKAAYPSSVLMNAIPAQVAGVERIVVVTPPKSLEENPLVAAALDLLGICRGLSHRRRSGHGGAGLWHGNHPTRRQDRRSGQRLRSGRKATWFTALSISI